MIKHFLQTHLKTTSYHLFPLTPEGSKRLYFRVKTKNQTWILVKADLKTNKNFTRKQKLFSSLGLLTPVIKANEEKMFLLEDLGNLSLDKKNQDLKKKNLKLKSTKILSPNSSILFYYTKALDKLLILRKAPKEKLKKFSFLKPFTKTDFLNELQNTEKYLIKKFYGLNLKPSLKKACHKEWIVLCQSLSQFPYTISHRDYHSRNLFIKKGKIFMIDFQDAGLFPRFYDLASLIYDPYVLLNATQKKLLIQYFLSHLKNPEELSKKDITKELYITALQRFFKASGNFAQFYILRRQTSHLAFILPTLKMLKNFTLKLNQYPVFSELLSLLIDEEKKRT